MAVSETPGEGQGDQQALSPVRWGALIDRRYVAMGGQIIDATVVPAPRQRNIEEEKAAIKEGRIPITGRTSLRRSDKRIAMPGGSVKYTKAKVEEGADPKAFKPVDLAIPMFGYKSHIGIDRTHGLIRTWDTSAANAHDDGADLSITPSRISGPIRATARRGTRSSPAG